MSYYLLPMATCPAHLNLLDLITLTILGERYKVLSSSLWSISPLTIRIPRGFKYSPQDKNGEWRRLHNEELHSLYRSPNIIMVIKSRRLKWAGHVARMEENLVDSAQDRNYWRVLVNLALNLWVP